jgi:uncharacterized protein YcaQ
MTETRISARLAKRTALNAQLLDGKTAFPGGKEGVAQVIESLGYVQIDTIAVVKRAHHHTLWTRLPDYDPKMLHELQAQDRRIFEYWGHAASYLPISDYRYYLRRMHEFDDPKGKWQRERFKKYGDIMEPILERIRKEGPLSSKDFAPSPGTKRGTWWDWKPAKTGLEMLFWKGDLMITERRNFQKVYDLTERVLPEGTDTSVPDNDELGRFLVRRALSAYGVAQEREIRQHIQAASKEVITKSLSDLVDAGEVIPVTIKEYPDARYYSLPEKIGRLKQTPSRVSFLSPFDNLIIQRERTRHLFGFDYTLECYVPAPKRKHGYFVLPILWGEDLVGRTDCKADRKSKSLIVRNLLFEPGFAAFDEFLPTFTDKLRDFSRFNQCTNVVIQTVSPGKIKSSVECILREIVPETSPPTCLPAGRQEHENRCT